jgi:hypothetical protein
VGRGYAPPPPPINLINKLQYGLFWVLAVLEIILDRSTSMNECPYCHHDIPARDLAAHLKKPHRNQPIPRTDQLREHCQVCDESFVDGTMRAHMKRKHADSKGHIHGIRHDPPVGGPGKRKYEEHKNSEGLKEQEARKRAEELDKQVIAQRRARREKAV